MTLLVVVGACKGAPGASTVALGVAACWPSGGAVLVEADPAGGDLGDRFGYATPPGSGSAATALRHGTGVGWLAGHAQRLPLEVDVVVGQRSAESAAAAVRVLAGHATGLRGHGGAAVVVDVGRLGLGSPAVPLLMAADVVLLVARAELADLRHVEAGLARWPSSVRRRVRLVVAGAGGYPAREIARDLGVPVVATVPVDRWGAGVLAGRWAPVRGWRRLRLPRALAEVASTLAAAASAEDMGAAGPAVEPAGVAEVATGVESAAATADVTGTGGVSRGGDRSRNAAEVGW